MEEQSAAEAEPQQGWQGAIGEKKDKKKIDAD